MDQLPTTLVDLLDDPGSMLMALLVFLAAGTLAFAVMALARSRGLVKRRTSRIMDESSRAGDSARSLRSSSVKAVSRLIEYTTKHYAGGNDENMKVLRQRLIQAGIYDTRGVAFFFMGRTALAVGLAAAVFVLLPTLTTHGGSFFWLMVIVGGIAGYVGPSMYIDRRIKSRTAQHRSGFPDFMDLLEIRAGRNLKDALERFAERLALEEGRAFATLINQSIDLGSSITDALRVYSDDMRHKRLSRAEEKAYALPAKLSVPMMVCIFPVLFVVILLPVIVRLSVGNYF